MLLNGSFDTISLSLHRIETDADCMFEFVVMWRYKNLLTKAFTENGLLEDKKTDLI